MKRSLKNKLLCIFIIVVIIITGIGAFVMFLNSQDTSARRKATITSIDAIAQSIVIYANKHTGQFPSSIEDLLSPYKNTPCDCFGDGKTLSDSWGTEFDYKTDGKTFSIRSAGPDMKMGTKDDIIN